MKEPRRYNSVKRALQRDSRQQRLSTNFTRTTMQKVRMATLAREKRENRILFFAIVAISLAMIIGCAYIIVPIMKDYTIDIKEHIRALSIKIDTIKLHFPIFVTLILLLLLDFKLRAIFKKRLDNQ